MTPRTEARDGNSLLTQSLEALERDDIQAALRLSHELVERFPDDPRCHVARARVLKSAGRDADALEVLSANLAMHAADPKTLAMMRTLASNSHQPGEALIYAQRLAELAPRERKNLLFLVDAHLLAKNEKAA